MWQELKLTARARLVANLFLLPCSDVIHVFIDEPTTAECNNLFVKYAEHERFSV